MKASPYIYTLIAAGLLLTTPTLALAQSNTDLSSKIVDPLIPLEQSKSIPKPVKHARHHHHHHHSHGNVIINIYNSCNSGCENGYNANYPYSYYDRPYYAYRYDNYPYPYYSPSCNIPRY